MTHTFSHYRRSLITSTAVFALLLAATPATASSSESLATEAARATQLPDTAAITGRPSYNSVRTQPQADDYASPVSQIEMPDRPLYPQLQQAPRTAQTAPVPPAPAVAVAVPVPVSASPIAPAPAVAIAVPVPPAKPMAIAAPAPTPKAPPAVSVAISAPNTAAVAVSVPLAAPLPANAAAAIQPPAITANVTTKSVAIAAPVPPAPVPPKPVVVAKAPEPLGDIAATQASKPVQVVKEPKAVAAPVEPVASADTMPKAPPVATKSAPLTVYSADDMNRRATTQAPAPAEPAKAVANAAIPAAPAQVARPTTATPPVATQAAMAPGTAMTGAAVTAPPPVNELSDASRSILSGVPSNLDAPQVHKGGKLSVARVSPEIQNILGTDTAAKEQKFESAGISITVRRPGLDTNFELNRAYDALMGGDTQTAITTYKNIISAEPRNEDALFGLAATYHRVGSLELARPVYGMLLKVNPNHREGLNNFLVLVSDESPEDALPELERLQSRNPNFSPITAQIAIVLDKLGYTEAAEEKMLHAIELAPENLSYKYNLAIMLDRHQKYADAAEIYRSLIKASLNGAAVPASVATMQKRLNYIVTELNNAQTAGR